MVMSTPANTQGMAAPPTRSEGYDDDALLRCLMVLGAAHGTNLTEEAILSGLPVENGRITPSLFGRAAKRVGLTSKVVKQPIERLNRALFPAVLLLKDERACVLLGFSEDGSSLNVVMPELGDTMVQLPTAEILAQYTGYAIYVRPMFRYDARAPGIQLERRGHWFWSVMAENRRLYRDVLVAAFLMNLMSLGMPLFTMNVYDRVIPNNATDTLWVLSAGLLVVLGALTILRVLRAQFVDLASSRADVKLSAHIMERVLGTRMESKPVSAGSMAQTLRAFESVREFISSATVTAFVDLPFFLLFIAVIGWISPVLMMPVLIGGVIIVFYSMASHGRMHELTQTSTRASAQRNSTLIEGLVGFETLKAFGAEAGFQRKWESSAALLSRISAQTRLLSTTAASISQLMQNLVGLTVIVVGVHQIAAGALSAGALMACYMLSMRAMGPIAQVVSLLAQYHAASASLNALDVLMQAEVERSPEASFISRKTFRGDLEFRDVSFTYPNQTTPSLRNVNLRINAGDHVAILGRIGSGKTTLEKLILGLYRPTSGALLVDGIDQRQLDPAELRRNIGYVPQDPTLFYGTLRENITLGWPLATDEAVVRAADVAGLTDYVNLHPLGFDMMIGERGESLSGGQRQSVAIGRAVVSDPPILLLDEPTASMDQASESLIKRKLAEYSKGKTLIVVTHRTSLLDLVSRVVILDSGKVVADGPKEQVIKALREGLVGKG
ncbi:MAG: type I secretion system permease/ATPase [Rhodoferax sp.]